MTGPAAHAFQQPHVPAAGEAGNSEGQVSAALGTKWAHAVNVRLVLERREASRAIMVSVREMDTSILSAACCSVFFLCVQFKQASAQPSCCCVVCSDIVEHQKPADTMAVFTTG